MICAYIEWYTHTHTNMHLECNGVRSVVAMRDSKYVKSHNSMEFKRRFTHIRFDHIQNGALRYFVNVVQKSYPCMG